MKYPDERIGGGPCNECGGCNTYCADCIDPLLENMSAVADAALAAEPYIWPRMLAEKAALVAALDALAAAGYPWAEKEEPTAKLYVDGGEWGSQRTDGRKEER